MNHKKKYTEALEKLRKALAPTEDGCRISGLTRDCLEDIFTELKETEGERVRKELIEFLKLPHSQFVGNREHEKWIAWLEKQGEQETAVYGHKFRVGDIVKSKSRPMLDARKIISIDKDCYWCEDGRYLGFAWEDDYELVEQKPTDKTESFKASDWYVSKVDGKIHNIYQSVDKAEPKFKAGDWIVDNKTPNDVFCVIEVLEEIYKVIDIDGDDYHIPHCKADKQFHLWTIQDAKDGDALVTSPEKGSESNEQIFLFKAINSRDYVDDCIEYYFRLCDGVFYKNTIGYMGTILDTFYPATKEQRELLFQKMKDTGYEWRQEEKKLIKINEPKFKVGDWIIFNGLILHIDEVVNGYYITTSIGDGIHNSYDWDIDNAARLWTIQDAKDGDVLVFKNNIGGIIICKSPTNYDTRSYCRFICNDFIDKEESGWDSTLLVPATKEQRDLLFQKMEEAGYEWDADKKELKKIGTKFKVGDWITTTDEEGNVTTEKIIEFLGDKVRLIDINGLYSLWPKHELNYYHIWTINDANDGDVLAWDNSKCIALFKNIYDEDSFNSYGLVGHCTGIFEPRQSYHDIKGAHPATKEQCDLLFQKMRESGYEWDTERKELKKMEVASKESKDERIKREILELVSIAGNGNQFEEIKDWLEKQEQVFEQGYAAGAKLADKHPHWISVKDRKPKLKHSEDNMKYSDTVNVTNGKYRTSARWLHNTWAGWYGWYDDGDEELKGITHWMPMPELPKKGGNQ